MITTNKQTINKTNKNQAMKKIILSLAVAAICSSAFVSCKKENAAKAPVVIPIQQGSVEQFIKNMGAMAGSDGNHYELGVVFHSGVSGTIKSFKLHLPQTGNYLVALWKVSDKSIVTNTPVSCTHTDSWDDSVEVNTPIEANTDYILSLNANIFYYFTATSELFPYKSGDITLTGFAGKVGPDQVFPDLPLSQTPAGFVDFTFQRSE